MLCALLMPVPAWAAHTGAIGRNGYSAGDAATFVVVAAGLWLAQRAMRRRHRRADRPHQD